MAIQVNYIGKDIENVKSIESEGEDSPYLSVENIKYFKPMFSFLNPKDRDILYLVFLSKIRDILRNREREPKLRLECIT